MAAEFKRGRGGRQAPLDLTVREEPANDPAVRVLDGGRGEQLNDGINWPAVLVLLIVGLFWLDVALAVITQL